MQGMHGPPPFANTHALCEHVRRRKTCKYRLYPKQQQKRLLEQQLEECRWLYNHLLAERRDAWEQRQESLRLYDQHATLPVLKAERPSWSGVQSQVVQNVAVRSDLAFPACFRRVKSGEEKPGYPRFRSQGRYDSCTCPQVPVGCQVDTDARRLRLMNSGQVKSIWHRPPEGTPQTATLQRSSTGKWSVSFSCACAQPAPLPTPEQRVGLDVGLKTFATRSTGDAIANPQVFRKEEHALARVQRRRSNEARGTPERATRRKIVARVHERLAWRRSDCTHQHSRRIVRRFEVLAVEDVSVKRLVQNQCLAKRLHDAAWSQFSARLAYQAAGAGRKVVAVNPA